MEAFKLTFLVTDSVKGTFSTSTRGFAATGWEAAEKARRYIERTNNYKMVVFLKWRVLSPSQVWFK